MKKYTKKKGFTIVELVIVIAVVGVLTAVLVPTFVNLANRAKEAENQTFVRNLNTQMGIREATEGKNKTMYEAVMEAEDIGYNVEKLTPVDGNDVVWDSVANRFAIVKTAYAINPTKENVVYSDGGIKATEVHEIWKMYGGESEMPTPEKQNYSIYAKETTSWDNIDIKNLHVGFDAGKNTKIKSIHYVGNGSSRDVAIRTNSASTNIALDPYVDSTDATKGDHISFYGKAGQITGPKDENGNYTGFTVAFNSIAINGKVVGLKAASGHIDLTNAVVEKDEEIIVLATTTDVKVSNPKNVSIHAHATSAGNANVMNDPADSTKKSVGVTWDYDGNVAQNGIDDIHHHITEEQAAQAGESLGTGPVDGGENWVYEKAVETAIEKAVNEEAVEKAKDAGYVVTHHEAKAPSCTEVGYYAYDSYEVNGEVVKIGYKEVPALGHQKAENPTYQTAFSGGKWQHATQCIVDSEWIVEDCVDENNDNACDVCGHQMYIEVNQTSDLYQNPNYSTQIASGAYKLTNDVSLKTLSYIHFNVVIDLNGHTLSNYAINSPADAQFGSYSNANKTFTLTLKDSSKSKTGLFMSRFGDVFFDGSGGKDNNKFVLICEDGVKIDTTYDYSGNELQPSFSCSTPFINSASKNIEIINATIICGNVAYVNSGYTAAFKNCTIQTKSSSDFNLVSGSGSIVFDGCTITTYGGKSNALDSSSYPTVTFTNGTTVNGATK